MIETLFFKKTNPFWRYVFLFILIILANLIFPVNAKEYDDNSNDITMDSLETSPGFEEELMPQLRLRMSLLKEFQEKGLTYEQKKEYLELAEKFNKDGTLCLKQAEQMSWYLPSRKERDYAKSVLRAAIAALAGSDIRSKIVAGCASLLYDYIEDATDEWKEIKRKLYWSEYYFEMAEFYQDLAKKG